MVFNPKYFLTSYKKTCLTHIQLFITLYTVYIFRLEKDIIKDSMTKKEDFTVFTLLNIELFIKFSDEPRLTRLGLKPVRARLISNTT